MRKIDISMKTFLAIIYLINIAVKHLLSNEK